LDKYVKDIRQEAWYKRIPRGVRYNGVPKSRSTKRQLCDRFENNPPPPEFSSLREAKNTPAYRDIPRGTMVAPTKTKSNPALTLSELVHYFQETRKREYTLLTTCHDAAAGIYSYEMGRDPVTGDTIRSIFIDYSLAYGTSTFNQLTRLGVGVVCEAISAYVAGQIQAAPVDGRGKYLILIVGVPMFALSGEEDCLVLSTCQLHDRDEDGMELDSVCALKGTSKKYAELLKSMYDVVDLRDDDEERVQSNLERQSGKVSFVSLIVCMATRWILTSLKPAADIYLNSVRGAVSRYASCGFEPNPTDENVDPATEIKIPLRELRVLKAKTYGTRATEVTKKEADAMTLLWWPNPTGYTDLLLYMVIKNNRAKKVLEHRCNVGLGLRASGILFPGDVLRVRPRALPRLRPPTRLRPPAEFLYLL
jgi:hypothetical protein